MSLEMEPSSDISSTTPEEQFRQKIRSFRTSQYAHSAQDRESITETESEGAVRAKKFQKALAKAGLAGIVYPKQFGGAGLSEIHQEIFNQEVADWDLPNTPLSISLGMCLPMLNKFGTSQQKVRFMPDLIKGNTIWCQLFSEPGAGSDVASLATRATRDGNEWILEGQKVWTSGAHYCDYGLVVARTDPTQPKHQGLSMFIVNLRQTNIDIRRLRQISGGSGFNEVFFNEARIPVEYQIGELGHGWNLALAMLMFERVSLGAGGGPLNVDRSPELIRSAQEFKCNTDPLVRQQLADLWLREQIRKFISARIRTAAAARNVPGPEGSLAKLNASLLARRVRDVSLTIAGASSQAWDPKDAEADRWSISCISAAGISLAGGTDEVQRNIIGERVLGLPKDPDPYKGIAWQNIPRS